MKKIKILIMSLLVMLITLIGIRTIKDNSVYVIPVRYNVIESEVLYTNSQGENKRDFKLYVPKESLIEENEKYYANVICEDSKSRKVEVETGEVFKDLEDDFDMEYIEILSGLSCGDTIVREFIEKNITQ